MSIFIPGRVRDESGKEGVRAALCRLAIVMREGRLPKRSRGFLLSSRLIDTFGRMASRMSDFLDSVAFVSLCPISLINLR